MEDKDKEIKISKEVWTDLLNAYDSQNRKFIGVFKTIIICATIIISIWFIGYFTIPRINQNNGIIQNGNTNRIESIENTNFNSNDTLDNNKKGE